ncbi:MAG: DUF1638 domain-containing protein [Halodesulfurarchaeum sp.]
MNGVVACETLYPELPHIDPDAAVTYVPQWYHEYPIHTPESETARELLQERIDELEARGVEQVIVIYHDPVALTGLTTDSVPLHVYRGRDCIELHLREEPSAPGGERKQEGTYYLTRGWIDAAVDSYKVYNAYAGTLDGLIARFEDAKREHPDMRVSWPEAEKIQQAAARSETMSADPAKLLRKVIGGYRHVVLVDTGRLTPFHHEYAESFREFLATIGPEAEPRDVSLTVEEGTAEHLEAILRAPTAVPKVVTVEPGVPVPEEAGFRTGPQHP